MKDTIRGDEYTCNMTTDHADILFALMLILAMLYVAMFDSVNCKIIEKDTSTAYETRRMRHRMYLVHVVLPMPAASHRKAEI